MRCRTLSRPSLGSLTALAALLVPLGVLGCGGGGGASGGSGGQAPNLGTVDDIMSNLPQSCAFACGAACAEPEQPYACPTILPWSSLPHADACGAWDGTYPTPTAGKCTASEPTGDAIAKAGPIAGGLILPDGHRIHPAGREVVFAESDLMGGFPQSIMALPGTRYALSSDGGIQDNALRLLSLDALAGSGAPVASYVPFHQTSLFYGMAWLPPDRALASGGGDGVVYAFDVDTTAGTVKAATMRDIPLGTASDGSTWYAGPIAATADGSRLLVAPSDHAQEILVLSLGATDYGKQLASISVAPSDAIFDLRLDPFDPSGTLMYASDPAGSRLLEIDAATAKITRTLSIASAAKNPEQIVFFDAAYMFVAEADSDDIAIVDRAAFTVAARVPAFASGAPHGFSPSALAYDPIGHRLYATLAGVNEVEAFEVTPGAPPTIAPAGRFSTGWWPTGVMVDTDGSVVVVNGKGHGTGTDDMQHIWGNGGPITSRMHGSVQRVPAASLASLAPLTTVADQGYQLGDLAGASVVTCPAGADDFPVPSTNTAGPSSKIKHVILVVRENKAYDSAFGDRADLGDGDPSLIMATDPVLEGKIWQNARSIAHAFTNFDNFYTDAEQSIQGHIWTVHGRTTDFMERTWLTIWGRGTRSIGTPDLAYDLPQEHGAFAWLSSHGVDNDDMGEIEDPGPNGADLRYPGLYYAQDIPDVDKSCYMAGRIRLTCDLAPFTYATQPDDHTYGGSAGEPAPEIMIAVNDEAIGLLLDGLSHSPLWESSLLLVTEDDPQDGGDHVDLHRTLFFMASPWVRRGYVSHGHYDMASAYKVVAHVFGVPYNNEMMKDALLPFEAFTSTPDYTPFTYVPRSVTAPCNAATGKEAREAEGWDFHDPDDQPGLSEQIGRMMKEPREARGIRVLP